jgi:polygalacturonase
MKTGAKVFIVLIIVILIILIIAGIGYYFVYYKQGKSFFGGINIIRPPPPPLPQPHPSGPEFKITDYGASTSSADNSKAIIATFAAAKGKNGTVVVPMGTFMITSTTITGAINTAFRLDGKLQCIKDMEKFKTTWPENQDKKFGVLKFGSCKGLLIYGKGILDGNPEEWQADAAKNDNSSSGPSLFTLQDCDNVEIKEITIQNSAKYNMRLFDSTNLKFHDFKIINPKGSFNTDGINIEQGVKNMEAYNLDVASGDDGFAINAFATNTSDILVRDSIFKSGHGVSIGSGTYQMISNITFRNLQIVDSKYGTRIKCKIPPSSYPQGNSYVKNVKYENIKLSQIGYNPIYIDTSYASSTPTNVKIESISYKNYICSDSGQSSKFDIDPASALVNPIILNNVILNNVKRVDPDDIETNAKFDIQGPVKGVSQVEDTS